MGHHPWTIGALGGVAVSFLIDHLPLWQALAALAAFIAAIISIYKGLKKKD